MVRQRNDEMDKSGDGDVPEETRRNNTDAGWLVLHSSSTVLPKEAKI